MKIVWFLVYCLWATPLIILSILRSNPLSLYLQNVWLHQFLGWGVIFPVVQRFYFPIFTPRTIIIVVFLGEIISKSLQRDNAQRKIYECSCVNRCSAFESETFEGEIALFEFLLQSRNSPTYLAWYFNLSLSSSVPALSMPIFRWIHQSDQRSKSSWVSHY